MSRPEVAEGVEYRWADRSFNNRDELHKYVGGLWFWKPIGGGEWLGKLDQIGNAERLRRFAISYSPLS